MNGIQELQKDWAEVMLQSCPVSLVAPFGEWVPKCKPVLLQHHTESLQGAVVRVQQQLHQGHNLGGGKASTNRQMFNRGRVAIMPFEETVIAGHNNIMSYTTHKKEI